MVSIDRVLDVIDAGLQSSPEHGYGTDHAPDRCARCQQNDVGDGDLCVACRMFLLGDIDVDPRLTCSSRFHGLLADAIDRAADVATVTLTDPIPFFTPVALPATAWDAEASTSHDVLGDVMAARQRIEAATYNPGAEYTLRINRGGEISTIAGMRVVVDERVPPGEIHLADAGQMQADNPVTQAIRRVIVR